MLRDKNVKDFVLNSVVHEFSGRLTKVFATCSKMDTEASVQNRLLILVKLK